MFTRLGHKNAALLLLLKTPGPVVFSFLLLGEREREEEDASLDLIARIYATGDALSLSLELKLNKSMVFFRVGVLIFFFFAVYS